MVFELIFLSALLCLACSFLLLVALRNTTRWVTYFLGGVWFFLSFPVVYVCWLFVVQVRGVWGDAVGLFDLETPAAVVMHTFWAFWSIWQLSVVLAAIVPITVFLILVLSRPTSKTINAVFALAFLTLVGMLFTVTTSLLWMLVSFELLLLVSIYLLRLTAKSERVVEAATEMFFWTLAGSVSFVAAIVFILSSGAVTTLDVVLTGHTPILVILALCFGFGVKLPIWPCFSWLLKAHVEASVEFSILLSGIVVKFGALGLYRVLSFSDTSLPGFLVASCSTIAIVEAFLRIWAQRDLKRVVALTTVIEINWVGLCIGLGGAVLDRVGAFVLVAHSLTTTAEFFMVECLYKRYHSRDLVSISGLAMQVPALYGLVFFNVLTTIGFPGSSLFTAKLLFFTTLVHYSLTLTFFLAFILVLGLPLVFMRIWVPIWYGQVSRLALMPDVSAREAAILLICILGSVWLGLNPALVLGF